MREMLDLDNPTKITLLETIEPWNPFPTGLFSIYSINLSLPAGYERNKGQFKLLRMDGSCPWGVSIDFIPNRLDRYAYGFGYLGLCPPHEELLAVVEAPHPLHVQLSGDATAQKLLDIKKDMRYSTEL